MPKHEYLYMLWMFFCFVNFEMCLRKFVCHQNATYKTNENVETKQKQNDIPFAFEMQPIELSLNK